MRVRDGHEIVRTVLPRFARPVIVGDTSTAEIVSIARALDVAIFDWEDEI